MKKYLSVIILTLAINSASSQALLPQQIYTLPMLPSNFIYPEVLVPVTYAGQSYKVKANYMLFPYYSYVGLLNQASTGAPTSITLSNEFSANPTYAYDSVGTYTCTIPGGGLTIDKTAFFFTSSAASTISFAPQVSFTRLTDSTFRIRSTKADVPMNSLLNNASLEIRVYH